MIEKPNFGALLEIRPTRSLSNGATPTVVVDLKSTVTAQAQPQPAPEGNGQSAAVAPVVDRMAIEIQEFATTLRMPFGTPMLVGGLTYAPPSAGRSDAGGEPATAGETPQLYLVLEVR